MGGLILPFTPQVRDFNESFKYRTLNFYFLFFFFMLGVLYEADIANLIYGEMNMDNFRLLLVLIFVRV